MSLSWRRRNAGGKSFAKAMQKRRARRHRTVAEPNSLGERSQTQLLSHELYTINIGMGSWGYDGYDVRDAFWLSSAQYSCET